MLKEFLDWVDGILDDLSWGFIDDRLWLNMLLIVAMAMLVSSVCFLMEDLGW